MGRQEVLAMVSVVGALVFFTATVSYSFAGLGDRDGIITSDDPGYAAAVNGLDLEGFNAEKGVALVNEDGTNILLPSDDEASVLVVNGDARAVVSYSGCQVVWILWLLGYFSTNTAIFLSLFLC